MMAPMSDLALTWLSTIAWFVLTGALFLALARWSAGNGSWTILPGFVRGVREWMAGDLTVQRASSSPGSFVFAPSAPPADEAAEAEIEDL